MQTNKVTITLTLLAFLGCKKTSSNLNSIELDKNPIVQVKDSTNKNTEKKQELEGKSFAISCGSGCAMTYSALEIVRHENNLKVKFKVEMYVDETLSDTYYETFIFSYTDYNKLIKINKEGKTEDFLKTQMPSSQESFIYFGESIAYNNSLPATPIYKNTEVQEKYNITTLPFDFESYYSLCAQDEIECVKRYPSYNLPDFKKILDFYNIKEAPTKFFILPQFKGFQPIICAYTDSDIEGYYLFIAEKEKVISSLKIGQSDGEKIQDFVIGVNYEIQLYSRNSSTEKRVLKKTYILQNDGILK